MATLAQLNLKVQATEAAQAARDLDNLERSAARAEASFSRLYGPLTTVLSAIASFEGAKAAVKLAADMEQLSKSFNYLVGSAELAGKMLDQLWDIATRQGFEIKGLAQNVQYLIAVGFEGQKAVDTIKTLNNFIAATGKGDSELQRLAKALSDITVKQRLQAEELRQFSNVGVDAIKILAEAAGKTQGEFMELVTQRQISGAQAAENILIGLNRKYDGAADALSTTYTRLFIRLQETSKRTIASFTQDILEFLRVKDRMQELLPIIERIGASLRNNVISVLSDPWSQAIFSATAAFTAMVIAVNAVTLAVGGLNLAFTLLERHPVLAAISLLIGAMVLLKDETVKVGDETIKVGEIMVAVFEEAKERIVKNFEFLFPKVKPFFDQMNTAIKQVLLGIDEIMNKKDPKNWLPIGGMTVQSARANGLIRTDAEQAAYEAAHPDPVTEIFRKRERDLGITPQNVGFSNGMIQIPDGDGVLRGNGPTSRPFVIDPSDPASHPSFMDAVLARAAATARNRQANGPGMINGVPIATTQPTTQPSVEERFPWKPMDLQNPDGNREKSLDRARERLAEYLGDLDREQSLVGKTREERERVLRVHELENLLIAAGVDDEIKRAAAMDKYAEQLGKVQQMEKSFARIEEYSFNVADILGQGLEDAIMQSRDLGDIVKAVYLDITRATLRATLIQPFQEGVAHGIQGILQGPTGGLFGFGGANGLGNVFSGGGVVPFRNGGVVSGPTMFPMSGGRQGVMGEDGEEGIFPLARGADGKLGVRGTGGGKTVNVTMIVNTPNADSFRRSERQTINRLKQSLES